MTYYQLRVKQRYAKNSAVVILMLRKNGLCRLVLDQGELRKSNGNSRTRVSDEV